MSGVSPLHGDFADRIMAYSASLPRAAAIIAGSRDAHGSVVHMPVLGRRRVL